MAFAGGSSIGTGVTAATATSTTITTSTTANAGDLVVVRVAKDNTSTTDGVTNEVTSVTDSAGNSYTKGGEYTNGQAAANAGATVALFYSKLASQLSSGGTITISHDSKTDVAASANAYTTGAGTTIAQGGTTQTLAVDGGNPGSMSLSGLTSREYLFLRAVAEEEEAGSATTPTSGYTASDVVVSTTAGAATSNITLRGEAIILTGTGSTSNPSGDVADSASIFLALYEVAGGGGAAAGVIGGGVSKAGLVGYQSSVLHRGEDVRRFRACREYEQINARLKERCSV